MVVKKVINGGFDISDEFIKRLGSIFPDIIPGVPFDTKCVDIFTLKNPCSCHHYKNKLAHDFVAVAYIR